MKLKKLNQRGVAHYVALMLIVVGAGIIGSAAVVASHAQTPPPDANSHAPSVWCPTLSVSPNPAQKNHHHVDTVVMRNSGNSTAYNVKFIERDYIPGTVLGTWTDGNGVEHQITKSYDEQATSGIRLAPGQSSSKYSLRWSTAAPILGLQTRVQFEDSQGRVNINQGSCRATVDVN